MMPRLRREVIVAPNGAKTLSGRAQGEILGGDSLDDADLRLEPAARSGRLQRAV